MSVPNRCRCGMQLSPDGTCRFGCPPKHARQVSRRNTVGVKERVGRLITAEEAREGIRKVIPDWDRQVAPVCAAARKRLKKSS